MLLSLPEYPKVPIRIHQASLCHQMEVIALGSIRGFKLQLDSQILEFPGVTAGAEDWAFQGVDTSYWSLLNGASFRGRCLNF